MYRPFASLEESDPDVSQMMKQGSTCESESWVTIVPRDLWSAGYRNPIKGVERDKIWWRGWRCYGTREDKNIPSEQDFARELCFWPDDNVNRVLEYHAKERVNGSQRYFGKYDNGTMRGNQNGAKIFFSINLMGPTNVLTWADPRETCTLERDENWWTFACDCFDRKNFSGDSEGQRIDWTSVARRAKYQK